MDEAYVDILVIGAGPAGYPAAIKGAQSGKKVAIIEKKDLGGTCLNVGCIPSKSLLYHTEHLSTTSSFQDISKKKSDAIVTLRKGINYLLKKNKITLYEAEAYFPLEGNHNPDRNTVIVHAKNETTNTKITAKNVIIATGSTPAIHPSLMKYKELMLTTDYIFSLEKPPKSIIIIGGGYIGLEMATVFARFGSKVTIIEALDAPVKELGPTISTFMQEEIKKLKIDLRLNCKVERVEKKNNEKNVFVSTQEKPFSAEEILICTGRTPHADNLGLENLPLIMKNEFIQVNEQFQTNFPNIYAIGDVSSKSRAMLAHVASDQAEAVIDIICHNTTHQRYEHHIPAVVYTLPEVAVVGYGEENQIVKKAQNIKIPVASNGKAVATENTSGFVQIFWDKDTHEIVRAVIVAKGAGDMISTFTLAMIAELTIEEIARTIFPHPTISEVIKEAASVATNGKAIHV